MFMSQTFNITFLYWDSYLNYIFKQVLSNPKFCDRDLVALKGRSGPYLKNAIYVWSIK